LREAGKNANRLVDLFRRRGNLFRLKSHSPIDEIATAQQTFFFTLSFNKRLAMTTTRLPSLRGAGKNVNH